MSKKPENMSFEESLSELDSLVNQLEQGDLDLEEALKHFERGIALTRASQTKLTAAEQRVKVLLEKNGEENLVDFAQDASTNEQDHPF